MTHIVPTPEAARTSLEATIREQLREAWQRGMDTAPHGLHALADAGAPHAFAAIMTAADDYGTAIASLWAGRHGCPPPAGGQ